MDYFNFDAEESFDYDWLLRITSSFSNMASLELVDCSMDDEQFEVLCSSTLQSSLTDMKLCDGISAEAFCEFFCEKAALRHLDFGMNDELDDSCVLALTQSQVMTNLRSLDVGSCADIDHDSVLAIAASSACRGLESFVCPLILMDAETLLTLLFALDSNLINISCLEFGLGDEGDLEEPENFVEEFETNYRPHRLSTMKSRRLKQLRINGHFTEQLATVLAALPIMATVQKLTLDKTRQSALDQCCWLLLTTLLHSNKTVDCRILPATGSHGPSFSGPI